MRDDEFEDLFKPYGRLVRCDLKKGGFGFVEFEERDHAEDALKALDDTEVLGRRIVVQYAKNPIRKTDDNSCFKCGQSGHWARDCPDSRGGYGGRDRGGYGGYGGGRDRYDDRRDDRRDRYDDRRDRYDDRRDRYDDRRRDDYYDRGRSDRGRDRYEPYGRRSPDRSSRRSPARRSPERHASRTPDRKGSPSDRRSPSRDRSPK